MKKRSLKKESNENISTGEDPKPDGQIPAEMDDPISIQDFIKLKKLQNQVLEKMLDQINSPDPKEKIKNKKNK